MDRRRSIVSSPEFIDELEVFVGEGQPALEFIARAEDLLSREPRSGVTADGEVWLLSLAPIGDLQLTIYYAFDGDNVLLLAIRPS